MKTPCYWSPDWKPVNPPINARRKEPEDGIVVRSPGAKKVLGRWLAEHDPEFLALCKAFGDGFGTLEAVIYEENADLRRVLDEFKRKTA